MLGSLELYSQKMMKLCPQWTCLGDIPTQNPPHYFILFLIFETRGKKANANLITKQEDAPTLGGGKAPQSCHTAM